MFMTLPSRRLCPRCPQATGVADSDVLCAGRKTTPHRRVGDAALGHGSTGVFHTKRPVFRGARVGYKWSANHDTWWAVLGPLPAPASGSTGQVILHDQQPQQRPRSLHSILTLRFNWPRKPTIFTLKYSLCPFVHGCRLLLAQPRSYPPGSLLPR